MLKNYLVIAFRNFWRKKIFSLINVAGLAIGISASLIIYLIVHYEFSYEKFQKDRNSIYRVVTNMHFPGQDYKNTGVPGPWLQDFTYRTHFSWWVFILAGMFAILIALLTVSFQAIKAAVANPVKSLRTE